MAAETSTTLIHDPVELLKKELKNRPGLDVAIFFNKENWIAAEMLYVEVSPNPSMETEVTRVLGNESSVHLVRDASSSRGLPANIVVQFGDTMDVTIRNEIFFPLSSVLPITKKFKYREVPCIVFLDRLPGKS